MRKQPYTGHNLTIILNDEIRTLRIAFNQGFLNKKTIYQKINNRRQQVANSFIRDEVNEQDFWNCVDLLDELEEFLN